MREMRFSARVVPVAHDAKGECAGMFSARTDPRSRASPSLEDAPDHSAGDRGDPSPCGPCTASAKRRPQGERAKRLPRAMRKPAEGVYQGRLLRVSRPRGAGRGSSVRPAHRAVATFHSPLHQVRPPTDRPDAAIHQRGHLRPGTHRHLCVSAVTANGYTLQGYPAAESIEFGHVMIFSVVFPLVRNWGAVAPSCQRKSQDSNTTENPTFR